MPMPPYKTPPPYDHDHENEVMPFAVTNFRNQHRKFGIKTDDRRRHVYVIGKTGMGKSVLLENMFLHDVNSGHGCCYVDPHGDTAQNLIDFIPPSRINDVVYFDPSDVDFPIGFNIFELSDPSQKNLVAGGLMSVFKKIWEGMWSSRMEYILLNTVLALLDAPGSTLLGINRLLSDEEYRKRVVSMIQDPVVKTFWVKEFAAFSEKYRTEAVAPVQNKVGQFVSSSVIRNIVAQVNSTMNLREIMDTRKILILNLSKGLIGEENSRLLGAMIISRLQLAAMERVDMPERDRQDFYLFVDEFQNFATESFATILSEARKYRLALTVAHQYIEQLDETVKPAVFGNVGTMITFRVGSPDAEELVKEFTPRFTEEDLVGLGKYEIYLKLMIDGASSEPFSANTLPPIATRTGSYGKVIRVTRERYAVPREKIEGKVLRWSGMGTVDAGGVIMTEEEQEAGEEPVEKMDDEEKVIEEKVKVLQASSPNIPELAGSKGKKSKPQFEMPCSVCGKVSKLNFEPDRSRPWFCKEHLEERQRMGPAAIRVPAPLPTSQIMAGTVPPSVPSQISPPNPPIRPPNPPTGSGIPPVPSPSLPKAVGLSVLASRSQPQPQSPPKSPIPPIRPAVVRPVSPPVRHPRVVISPGNSNRAAVRPAGDPVRPPVRPTPVRAETPPKPPPIGQANPVTGVPVASVPAISLSALVPQPAAREGSPVRPVSGTVGGEKAGSVPEIPKEPPKPSGGPDAGLGESDKKAGDGEKSLKPGQVIRF